MSKKLFFSLQVNSRTSDSKNQSRESSVLFFKDSHALADYLLQLERHQRTKLFNLVVGSLLFNKSVEEKASREK